MEAGDRTAGNGYEQDREHVSELFICKSCINRQVHGRMCNEQSENSADDHANEHVSGHHITGLFEQPDRKNCCEEDINKGNVSPGIFSGGDRKSHTDCQSCYGADKTYNGCFPAGKAEFLLQYAKYHSE